jgi:hypothetical protein
MSSPFRLSLLALAVAGCSSPDLSGPTSQAPAELPWSLTLSAHAITLDTGAPYDTLQLAAVAQTLEGAPIAGGPAPVFTSSDSSVRVSTTGLLTARAEARNVRIVATGVYGGIRVADTAYVNVTTLGTPTRPQALRIQTGPGDDATIPKQSAYTPFYAPYYKTVYVSVRNAGGAQLTDAMVALKAPDTTKAYFFATGRASYVTADTAVDVGIPTYPLTGEHITLSASATVYGVALRDSLQLTITEPVLFIYTVTEKTAPGHTAPAFTVGPTQEAQSIAAGGWVLWFNKASSSDSLDVVFDDPSAASADMVMPFLQERLPGNIAPFAQAAGTTNPFAGGGFRSRQFLRPGRFRWHSERLSVSGTVVVR